MANRATVTYNGSTVSTEDLEGSFDISYDGKTLATIGAGEKKTLGCSGKVMKTNVVIGGKTLLCAMKKMISDIVVAVESLFPSAPGSYSLIAKYTASQSWTAPEDGYFQIEAFGASGNGGKGGHFYQKILGSFSIAGSGGGGGGGGYACSRIKMKKGDIISLSVGAVGSETSATINSSLETYSALNVTSGGNGTDTGMSGTTMTGGTGGAGGIGSGGNYSNKTGGKGGNGVVNTSATSAPAAGTAGSSAQSGGNSGGKGGTGYSTATGLIYYDGAAGSAGFFKIYRGNTNSEESSGGETNSSVFYLQSLDGSVTREFEFEEGMTWSRFIASSYNDGKFTLDTATKLLIQKEGSYAGSSITGAMGYNGYAVFLDDFNATQNFDVITESENQDTLEVGRTYYCDGA